VALPVALGVNVTEQLPETKVHVVALNEPAAPVLDHVTVPVGVVVGAGEVSATVAVQVAATPTEPVGGHETVVDVFLLLTVILPLPLLVAWVVSPP